MKLDLYTILEDIFNKTHTLLQEAQVTDVQQTIDYVASRYSQQAILIDHTDGISFEFEQWRFNIRGSNTEPLLRLNVESRGDKKLLADKTAEIAELIKGFIQ